VVLQYVSQSTDGRYSEWIRELAIVCVELVVKMVSGRVGVIQWDGRGAGWS